MLNPVLVDRRRIIFHGFGIGEDPREGVCVARDKLTHRQMRAQAAKMEAELVVSQ